MTDRQTDRQISTSLISENYIINILHYIGEFQKINIQGGTSVIAYKHFKFIVACIIIFQLSLKSSLHLLFHTLYEPIMLLMLQNLAKNFASYFGILHLAKPDTKFL